MLKMWKIKEIIIGYSKLLLMKLGLVDGEIVASYKHKESLCTYDCPLKTNVYGFGFCDFTKTHEGERGCGCFDKAKWCTDSPCPLDKF